MNKLLFKFSIWIFLSLLVSPITQTFAGEDDGVDGGDIEGDDGGIAAALANIIPVFFPDADQHAGKRSEQYPPNVLPPMAALPVLPPFIAPPILQAPLMQLPILQKGMPMAQDKGQHGGQPQRPLDATHDDFTFEEYSDDEDFSDDNPSLHDSHDSLDPAFPIFVPEGDQHKGRGGEQLPSGEKPKRVFPHRLKDPRVDKKYGREVITLDGGSPDNPYYNTTQSLIYVGALLGGAFVEPDTMIQFNLLSKFKYTHTRSGHQKAKNYDEAIRKKNIEYPEKAKDFDKWEVGDWIQRNHTFSLALYAGVSYFSPDARVGVAGEVIKSIHIQKFTPDQVRVSMTRDGGVALIARAQAVPLQKVEAKLGGDVEQTRVYLFDMTIDDEKKALEELLQKNIIFNDYNAFNAAKKNKATLLTTRVIKSQRTSFTPVSAGIPFVVRARMSWYTERFKTSITTHRGNLDYRFSGKAYTRQSMYRHKNFKQHRGSHEGKSFWQYMDKHYDYSRACQGGVVKPVSKKQLANKSELRMKKDGGMEFVQSTEDIPKPSKRLDLRYLQIQLSFTNDRVKAEEVNDVIKDFSRKVGINDHVIDVGYTHDAMIGFAQVRWDFRVSPKAINSVIQEAVKNEKLFDAIGTQLINNYFAPTDGTVKNDPHKLCRTKLCKKRIRSKTKSALRNIAKRLRALDTESVATSSRKSSHELANIAKELRTNQFVLQAFILMLPPSIDGYGRLKVSGERFLAKAFNTDPGKHLREVNSYDASWSNNQAQGQEEREGEEGENDGDVHDYSNIQDEPGNFKHDVAQEIFEVDWNQRMRGRDDANEIY